MPGTGRSLANLAGPSPRATALLVVAVAALAGGVEAARGEPSPDTGTHGAALAILERRCHECHGAGERKGGLRLTSLREALTPADSGIPVLEPGSSEVSLLIERLETADVEERMPKDEDPLPAEEIRVLRAWIDAGAPWPEDAEPPLHWAYAPPRRPAPPEVRDEAWSRNAVDRFVLAALDEKGLRPSPPADRRTLLRRVTLDLTGLPPTPAEVRAFEADESPDAYEEVVDRLLASPAFGERWAQSWLDLARYADSNGFKNDRMRESWPYRDWVIRAINEDLPFDQFTIDQLAGDLVPDASADQLVASGFHRNTPLSLEAGVKFEEARIDQVIDRVNTTATVWLGTTMACAQCHNHKYDPFSQEEYYRLLSFFNNTPIEVEEYEDIPYFRYAGPTAPVPPGRETLALQARLERQTARELSEIEKSLGLAMRRRPQLAAAAATGVDWQPLEVTAVASEAANADDRAFAVETNLTTLTALRVEVPAGATASGEGGTPAPAVDVSIERLVGDRFVPVRIEDPRAAWSRAAVFEGGIVEPGGYTARLAAATTDVPAAAEIALPIPLHQPPGRGPLRFRIRVSGLGDVVGAPTFRLSGTASDPTVLGIDAETAKLLRTEKPTPAQSNRLQWRLARRLHPAPQRSAQRTAAKSLQLESPTAFVMQEMAESRVTHVFKRGNYLDTGKQVEPGTPAVLHPMAEDLPKNRLGLALWLVSSENPLLARVAVNRWWAQLFGRGIVRTLEDFGVQSEPPSHPGLLDWLAVELMENRWSRKHVLRAIVTSETYRQASAADSELGREIDPQNVFLWHAPRLRLPAETIRDQALAASGLLSTAFGGPPVYPPQPEGLWKHSGGVVEPPYQTDEDEDRFRRGVYVVWRRVSPYPAFTFFDAPDRTECVVDRSRTNTPLQALTLLNSEEFVEAALGLATRVLVDVPDGTEGERLERAFALLLAREPTAEESATLLAFLDRQSERLRADPMSAVDVLSTIHPSVGRPQPTDPIVLAAWLQVARVLLNLDETIHRG